MGKQDKIFSILYAEYLKPIVPFVIAMQLLTEPLVAQNELDVVKDSWLEFTDTRNSLYHYLSGKAYLLLKERAAQISGITTLEQWQQRQNYIRETMNSLIGPYPSKTPLNAKIMKSVEKPDFRIEHIVFESQPGFYVTSSLFIPAGLKKRNKAPAVIYCSGHSAEGYRSSVYMHVIQNLVRKGFVVFAFDPVGQGERLEYYDPATGSSIVGGPTKEHSYPGAQAFITGSSQALYMIWDGIRAVDYLLTRKEVDPLRIGITGRSGGGTQSAYIAAVDDRILAAAPENYITNFTRLFQSIGPQDAEQNISKLIINGLDHPDFLIVRAPKPTMMITTTRDMFSIQGARETRDEVSGIFYSYGEGGNFYMVEDDAPHESTVKNRESMYAFFQKFLNNPGSPADLKTEVLTKEELQVTPTGQVSNSFLGETVYSLNLKRLQPLVENLDNLRENPDIFYPGVLKSAESLSGYRKPEDPGNPVFTGRIIRDGYSVEKYFIGRRDGYIIPYLLFKPVKPDNRILIYLDPEGKRNASDAGGPIEMIVRKGIAVLAPDLLGTGEMGSGDFEGDANFGGSSHNLWYASILINRSITGINAGDVAILVRLMLKEYPESEIIGFARGEMSPILLHAAALNPEIKSIVLDKPYSSYRSIVNCRFYNPYFIHSTVFGALEKYDLPDLAASLAPRRLLLIDPTDGNGSMENSEELIRDMELIKKGYRNAENQLTIISSSKNSGILIEKLQGICF
jgi:cephalosporin-C deacetylase-like acetyl esterase